MYFVHPQINSNKKAVALFSCFFQKPDLEFLNKRLSFYFPNIAKKTKQPKKIIYTDMGRSALRIIIEKLNLRNSQMLFPSYICDIFFPILKKYNIEPIFLDADPKTFNLNVEEIEKKITPKTNSILVSHIYGLPNDMRKISSFARRHNLKIIEDCAHSFSAKSGKFYAGNYGDAAFFSLYKFLPTCRGGILLCPADWQQIEIDQTSFNSRDFISFLNNFPFWAFSFKKFAGLIAPKVIRKEKLSKIGGINKVSLNLLSCFLDQYKKTLNKRIKLALLFQKELEDLGFQVQKPKDNIFCFLSALMPEKLKEKREQFVKELAKNRIFCTRIWHSPIITNPEVQKKYKIDLKEFPNTLNISQRIVNFPLQNHYQKKDIQNMIKKIKLSIDRLS